MSKRILIFSILPLSAFAEIDSGGGPSSGGAFSNRSSIGSPFATLPAQNGSSYNHPGLIEVLYPVTPSSLADIDANSLPDGWEMQHFGHLGNDPNADADHDGTSNLMEYLAGTDPNNAASVFRPQGTYSGGVFRMPVQTVVGRNYKISVSRDLKSWTLHRTLTGDGTEQVFQFDETAITSGPLFSANHPSSYFFRIEILIP